MKFFAPANRVTASAVTRRPGVKANQQLEPIAAPPVVDGDTDSSGSSSSLDDNLKNLSIDTAETASDSNDSPRRHSLHALLATLEMEDHPFEKIHSGKLALEGSLGRLDVFDDDDDNSTCAAESQHSAVLNLSREFLTPPSKAVPASNERKPPPIQSEIRPPCCIAIEMPSERFEI